MRSSDFQMYTHMLDIWKIAIQTILFLVLWIGMFPIKKQKEIDITTALGMALFLEENLLMGMFPFSFWARHGIWTVIVLGFSFILANDFLYRFVGVYGYYLEENDK